jgi:malate dehydrogenase (quinone)
MRPVRTALHPQRSDGTIDVSKAILVNGAFQLSVQFYTWLVEHGIIESPSTFINPVPPSRLRPR